MFQKNLSFEEKNGQKILWEETKWEEGKEVQREESTFDARLLKKGFFSVVSWVGAV